MGEKGLRVNMGKTNVMMSGIGLDVLKPSDKYPCGVCHKGVGNNSMLCHGCSKWIHKDVRDVIAYLMILFSDVHNTCKLLDP